MINKKAILLALGVSGCNFFAGENQIITVPYKPAFSVRHPNLVKLSKVALIAGACYALNEYVVQKMPEFEGIITGANILAGMYGCYTIRTPAPPLSFVDSLLIDPQDALRTTNTIWREYEEQVRDSASFKEENLQDFLEETSAASIKYRKKCPLFLTSECEDEKCSLSRDKTGWRNIFEKCVSEAILEKIGMCGEREIITYTGFACRGAFLDAVILTQVLAQRPNAKLTIHLIDRNDELYICALDNFGMSRGIISGQKYLTFNNKSGKTFLTRKSIVIAEQMKEPDRKGFVVGADGKWHEVVFLSPDIDTEAVEDNIVNSCLETHNKYEQIITFLQSTFPQAQLSLFVHDTAVEYLRYIKRNNLNHADIIAAADIGCESNLKNNESMTAYKNLCRKTFKKKPAHKNFCLTGNSKAEDTPDFPGIGNFLMPQEQGDELSFAHKGISYFNRS